MSRSCILSLADQGEQIAQSVAARWRPPPSSLTEVPEQSARGRRGTVYYQPGASPPDVAAFAGLEREVTDLPITPRFESTKDDCKGPELSISLEAVAQASVNDLAAPDDVAAPRVGARARQLDKAPSRNETRLAARDRRDAPMSWLSREADYKGRNALHARRTLNLRHPGRRKTGAKAGGIPNPLADTNNFNDSLIFERGGTI